MKLGRITVPGYVVDLDDQNMIDEAKDCLAEDICNAVKYNELHSYLKVIEAPEASENDIPDFLTEEDENEED